MQLQLQLLLVISTFYILSSNLVFGLKSTTINSRLAADSLNDTYIVDINNIKLPINNRGILADVEIRDSSGNFLGYGHFEESTFLYSGGFALSGLHDGITWANGSMSASRVEDYTAGPVNYHSDSTLFRIYTTASEDQSFGESWLNWKDAVTLGANFYDGNGDGIYNPLDLNDNGIWDPNEDKPDLIGDITTWCVFNDGASSSERRYSQVKPMGIEVKQTVFAYSPDTHPELSNVIFIRYNILNSGLVVDILDSVYFSAWTDADLGNYIDDLVASDTLLNSGIYYNDGEDSDFQGNGYGTNSPAFLTTFLQGPATYISGITFEDKNNNQIFDESIDTPILSAKSNHGPTLGSEILHGATNMDIASVCHYMKSDPTLGDPNNEIELRCYQIGKNSNCELLDPCTWHFGIVNNYDCTNINPIYLYSGDPVTSNGWIANVPTDQRLMVSTGPIVLEKNKPIEIILAYIVGRGDDPLNSITVAREIAKDVIGFYESNFTEIPVSVEKTISDQLPTNLVLEQNYPNPFNTRTIINYNIPIVVDANYLTTGRQVASTTKVILKIYDILGREVETLINEPHKPGNYQIEFDARNLSTGVYYYQLKAGNLIQTKKMILLK